MQGMMLGGGGRPPRSARALAELCACLARAPRRSRCRVRRARGACGGEAMTLRSRACSYARAQQAIQRERCGCSPRKRARGGGGAVARRARARDDLLGGLADGDPPLAKLLADAQIHDPTLILETAAGPQQRGRSAATLWSSRDRDERSRMRPRARDPRSRRVEVAQSLLQPRGAPRRVPSRPSSRARRRACAPAARRSRKRRATRASPALARPRRRPFARLGARARRGARARPRRPRARTRRERRGRRLHRVHWLELREDAAR